MKKKSINSLTAMHFFNALLRLPCVHFCVHAIKCQTYSRVHNYVHRPSLINCIRVQNPDTNMLILNRNMNLVALKTIFVFLANVCKYKNL